MWPPGLWDKGEIGCDSFFKLCPIKHLFNQCKKLMLGQTHLRLYCHTATRCDWYSVNKGHREHWRYLCWKQVKYKICLISVCSFSFTTIDVNSRTHKGTNSDTHEASTASLWQPYSTNQPINMDVTSHNGNKPYSKIKLTAIAHWWGNTDPQ